ncbi:SusC/RagA family TonB-linked outer membrane protein [Emticicia aquatilis]|uniref:SusC/RagA family TonB-linked outer membrane protein n=1 Tax=Emticicia aquatilis TaxID=1537369 RepID=A0A916YX43_9BACT|nr:SusC/RagA family TonB-linked outer membrane protein [Emticicia aquatilis]GGD64771.1 SusC/RagA family TonB-linked outer membrane protein [Emticicia aquatilis]
MKKTLRQFFNAFILSLFVFSAYAQNVKITGKVTDDGGSPLYGVNVAIKGSTKGTISDDKGMYSIEAAKGSELTFSYIGFSATNVTVGSSNVINVSLKPEAGVLNEVVVTALGISKEARKVGYAVTTVNGDQMTKARETNVAYSMAGRVAGLNISGTNGGSGSSARILLRGMASFTASSPLIVLNGVPIDNTQRGSAGEWGGADNGDGISNLNPDDIESMSVLKGASASALYGARAANGVILITTKSGKKGKMSVDYNLNTVAEQAINYTDYQYVYGQGLNGKRPANTVSALNSGMLSWGEKLDGASTIQFDGKSYPYSAVKDNIKNFYRTGSSITNSLAIASGNETGSFRLSLANLGNNSILRNSGLDRKTANFTGSQKFGQKLKVDLMVNYVDEKNTNKPQLSDGPMNANNINFLATNVAQSVLMPGYDASTENGNEIQYNDDIYVTNPWFVVNRYRNDVKRKRMLSALTAKYDITKKIYSQIRFGYDLLNDGTFKVTPTGTAYSNGQKGGLDDLSKSTTSELNAEAILGGSFDLVKDISLDAIVGAAARKNKYDMLRVGGGPFVIPFFYSPYNVLSFNRDYGYSEKQTNSAFYSLDFNYKNQLILSTTGRYDAFSTLPKDNYGIFTPSVSLSYDFTDLANSSKLSYGKFRASYAVVSGEPASPYSTSQYYSVGGAIQGITTGSFSSTLPNLFLKPYTLSEFELGTELKFYKNRLGFDVAYFNRKTHNEIINGSLSEATGFSSQQIGTGSTQNSGLEALVMGVPVETGGLKWTTSFNFTWIKNKIVEINGSGSADQQLGLGTYRPLNANTALIKGLPGPQIMAYDYVYDAQGRIVIDETGIPVQAAARTPMGSVLPKVYGGFNNEFSYKNFNLSFLFDYRFGNKVLSATNYYTIFRGLNQMTLEGRETGVVAAGVTKSGATNTVNVPAQTYYQNLARRISALNVMDGSFIKLRQVTLGYSLNPKFLGKTPIKSIELSIVGRNLLTLLKHTDNIDPEAGFSSVLSYAGIEGNSLPSTRTYGLNLNVKF